MYSNSVRNMFLETILTFQTSHINFSLCNRINWSFGNWGLRVLFENFTLADFIKDFVWKLNTIFLFKSFILMDFIVDFVCKLITKFLLRSFTLVDFIKDFVCKLITIFLFKSFTQVDFIEDLSQYFCFKLFALKGKVFWSKQNHIFSFFNINHSW